MSDAHEVPRTLSAAEAHQRDLDILRSQSAQLEAYVRQLRARVATLEDGIRVHKAGTDDCNDADCGCVTSADRRLWSLLDPEDTP